MNSEVSILTFAAAIFLLWFAFRKSLLKNNNNGPSLDPKKVRIPSPTSVCSATISSPSTSSSAAELIGKYEVFLSFSGTDTRHGFTDFLYTYLCGAGISTFRDNNELRYGEEISPNILRAIKDSKISIPIFSKNYASSKWCLCELAEMVECHKSEGQIIIPVFYDIGPSDVRNQTGNYDESFRGHWDNFDEKTVQGWKDALSIVGNFKGLDLTATNGHQGEVVKMVVEKVFLELKKKYTHIPDNLVGMDHHVVEMERLLDVDSKSTIRIVGIHGMGGIGKTTISKVIYNQLCDRFESCCFLDDVRERSHRNGITVLQNELVSKILRQQFGEINNIGEGIKKIKDVVHNRKVLLVLDDVDETSQFDKLVGECDWFGVGSRIVVTTRNKFVLDILEMTFQKKSMLEVYMSYEPKLMNEDHSLQLFSKYAFKQAFPPDDYESLSKDVVSKASGLPLVLVTIGSALFGIVDAALWKEIWTKLQKIPPNEVLDKLRISYESLDYQQKQIFLDIACLFIGTDKEKPYYMWEDCEFYPRSGINTLILRSLVKVGDDNKLRIHDQLRDLGRQIVREENLNKLRVLWHPKEASQIFKRDSGTEKVEALNLDLRAFKEDEYEHLQLVEATEQDKSVEPDYIHRFVRLDFSQLPMPNLRFLRLDYVFLDGDFSYLFSNLRWLEWRCCNRFLPTNLNLKNLVILDLSNSTVTTDDWEGWTQFKAAKKLKFLSLWGCTGIVKGPDFSTFTRVEILNLSRTNLNEISLSLGNLTTLRKLDLSFSNILNLNCSAFKDLENLNLHSCQSLLKVKGLEGSGSLENLKASECASLKTLGDLSNLKKLKELKICYSFSLTEIQGLENSECLELLDMRSCRSIIRLPNLSKMKLLKRLLLKKCRKLCAIEGLGSLESLELLDMAGCRSIHTLPKLSNMRTLKKLLLSYCKKLREVCGFEGLKSLEQLDMSWCESLQKISDLSNLGKLRTLSLSNCKKLCEIDGLSGLLSLESLFLSSCISLGKTLDFSYFKNLKVLKADRLRRMTEIKGLEELQSLEVLDISYCNLLDKLPDLSNLENLKINARSRGNHYIRD